MTDDAQATLANMARAIVLACSPEQKMALAGALSGAWRERRLTIGGRVPALKMPARPGRPERPCLLAPREMAKRSASGDRGRIALVHALAHIELNAIDLAFDLVARFADCDMPRAFFDDWVKVGAEEARHFALLDARLKALGSHYGALPAHDGLWEAAQDTGHSLLARLAVIPLVLEARGLDVTPAMIARSKRAGDTETATALETIYRDEKGHVAIGLRWFRHLCEREKLPPEPTFQKLVRRHFRGKLKPPFNDAARSAAGLTPGFYRPLAGLTGPTA